MKLWQFFMGEEVYLLRIVKADSAEIAHAQAMKAGFCQSSFTFDKVKSPYSWREITFDENGISRS